MGWKERAGTAGVSVIPVMEGEGEGKAGVFSVFFSWEPEDKVVPAMEKGIKGGPGSSEGESKGPTPLERF